MRNDGCDGDRAQSNSTFRAKVYSRYDSNADSPKSAEPDEENPEAENDI